MGSPIPSYVEAYERVRKAVPPADREKVWGSMIYVCVGKPPTPYATLPKNPTANGCEFKRRTYLGLGCEGPPELRERGTYIPVPFFAGVCERCGGSLMHDRWDEDEEFEPRPAPDGEARFRVPGKRTAEDHAAHGYGGADLVRTEAEKRKIEEERDGT